MDIHILTSSASYLKHNEFKILKRVNPIEY